MLNLVAKQEFIGRCPEMARIIDLVGRLARVDTSVLIRGESGTGKELIAQSLHRQSRRKDAPFVAVNASAIPETLIESELFGHERGAFTGADSRKAGRFEVAHQGTIFLDEIGDISPAMQTKLLRVLQEKRFCPVGSSHEIEVDVRIVTATHRPLEAMVQNGLFREDLFYRLNILPIHLPPLRHRLEDLEGLIQHFIQRLNARYQRGILGVSESGMEALFSHPWPGNIRELENALERAFIVESTDWIQADSLPESIGQAVQPGLRVDNLDFQASKEAFERSFLVRALSKFNGRINQTAEKANIPKKTLLRKLEKYQINAREFWIVPSLPAEQPTSLNAEPAQHPEVG